MEIIDGVEFLFHGKVVQSVGIDGPDGFDEFRKSDAQSAVFVDDHAVAIEDELVIAADLIKVYERDSMFFRVALHYGKTQFFLSQVKRRARKVYEKGRAFLRQNRNRVDRIRCFGP